MFENWGWFSHENGIYFWPLELALKSVLALAFVGAWFIVTYTLSLLSFHSLYFGCQNVFFVSSLCLAFPIKSKIFSKSNFIEGDCDWRVDIKLVLLLNGMSKKLSGYYSVTARRFDNILLLIWLTAKAFERLCDRKINFPWLSSKRNLSLTKCSLLRKRK